MNPSALRIRAISCFTRDAGISTTSCRAISALRMRVSISAIESVITPTAALPSPARLDQAGDLAAVSELPEADAAQAELPEHRPGPAAPPAAAVRPHFELWRSLPLFQQRLLWHLSAPSSPTARHGRPAAAGIGSRIGAPSRRSSSAPSSSVRAGVTMA